MLVHIIDGCSPDPVGDFKAIQAELELFAEDLASKPQASCLNAAKMHDTPSHICKHRKTGRVVKIYMHVVYCFPHVCFCFCDIT